MRHLGRRVRSTRPLARNRRPAHNRSPAAAMAPAQPRDAVATWTGWRAAIGPAVPDGCRRTARRGRTPPCPRIAENNDDDDDDNDNDTHERPTEEVTARATSSMTIYRGVYYNTDWCG